MIDLHTHSSASDGTMTPKDLVKYSVEKGLSVLALTDHDTVSGVYEAQQAAIEMSITFVAGIELNIQWRTGEFHLLGLGLQSVSSELKEGIDFLQKGRHERNAEIVQKMQKDNINISIFELEDKYGNCLGRPHFADWMTEHKIVKNRQQAFDKYLAKGRPYYIERQGLDLDKAIESIKASGGIPILAHPLSLYVSWGKFDSVFENLKERGIIGLEAYHPGARLSKCIRLEEAARRFGFIVTAGSDFHGEKIRSDRKIGKTSGDKKIDAKFWTDELYPELKKIGWKANSFC